MAVGARLRESLGIEVQSIWSDDGIAFHLPGRRRAAGDRSAAARSPEELDELVLAEVGQTALFGARFRENAARALLIPRRRPGERTPLWQQRLKAQGLLQVARKYASFPIVLETYRECLQDVFDLPALKQLLHGLRTRELDLVDVETASASPFASSLLFDYIATYMYEDDTPPAERRAQALSLDRDLLRELLGQEELRELIDADALAEVEASLRPRPTNPDRLHDLLRLRGDLRVGEFDEAHAAILEAERRAVRVRIAGDERLIAAEDAGRYRDALGVMPPSGLPDVVPRGRRRTRCGSSCARYARGRGPFTTGAGERVVRRRRRGAAARARARREARARRARVRAAPSASGAIPTCCAGCGARRSRRCAARSSRPSRRRSAGSCRAGTASTGARRCARRSIPLQALALPVSLWEAEVLPRRVPGYRPEQLDQLCASGELVWVGAGLDRVAVFFRDDAPLLGQPSAAPAPEGDGARRDSRRARGRRALLGGPARGDRARGRSRAAGALGSRLGGRGDERLVAAAARRAPLPGAAPGARVRAASRARARSRPTATQGRWSLAAGLFAGQPDRRALAELLLERQGIVTRDGVRGEGIPGGYGAVYSELRALETLGTCRRGYFVEGLGGAQFALGGAVERLRELRPRDGDEPEALVLAAADPAQPYGAAIPWPKRANGRAARVAGAHVVLLGGEAVLFVERGGRTLVPLREPEEDWLRVALAALVAHVKRGGAKRLAVERFDGEPVTSTFVDAAPRRSRLPRRPPPGRPPRVATRGIKYTGHVRSGKRVHTHDFRRSAVPRAGHALVSDTGVVARVSYQMPASATSVRTSSATGSSRARRAPVPPM